MKKQTKNIIIALAVLLVLGIAAAVLLMMPPAEDPFDVDAPDTQTQNEPTLLIDRSITDVKQIVIENGFVDETWTLIPMKDENAVDQNNTFTFKGWEDEEVIHTQALSAARSFYMLYSVKDMGDVENLADFAQTVADIFLGF